MPDSRKSAPFPLRNDAPCYGNWGVCYTAPQAERWAEANLRRNGFITYLPLYACRHPERITPPKQLRVLVPLFPRYLFVQHDNPDLWRPIRETPGVADVLQCGSRMQYANAGAVEALQASEAARRCLPAANASWAPGTPCSLRKGYTFEGLPAVIIDVSRDTATIGLMMLGHLRQISVPIDSLRARDDV